MPAAEPAASTSPDKPPAKPELLEGAVISGSVMLVLIALCANQFINRRVDSWLMPRPPQPGAWVQGQKRSIALTLVSADADRLKCAHDQALGDLHCEYTGKRTPWPSEPGAPLDDNGLHTIQPYRTAEDNQLVLVAGVWAQPELAFRHHREPTGTIAAEKQPRFVAYCEAEVLGELSDVSLRWSPDAAWQKEPKAWVARAQSCTLTPPTN